MGAVFAVSWMVLPPQNCPLVNAHDHPPPTLAWNDCLDRQYGPIELDRRDWNAKQQPTPAANRRRSPGTTAWTDSMDRLSWTEGTGTSAARLERSPTPASRRPLSTSRQPATNQPSTCHQPAANSPPNNNYPPDRKPGCLEGEEECQEHWHGEVHYDSVVDGDGDVLVAGGLLDYGQCYVHCGGAARADWGKGTEESDH